MQTIRLQSIVVYSNYTIGHLGSWKIWEPINCKLVVCGRNGNYITRMKVITKSRRQWDENGNKIVGMGQEKSFLCISIMNINM